MNNQLSKWDNPQIVDTINAMPELNEEDKRELQLQIASDDVNLRKSAMEKLMKSQLAQHDLMTIMGELTALNKEGMYIRSKQTIHTGSGKFEIEVKGGDTKLIVPVVVTIGIVILIGLYFLSVS